MTREEIDEYICKCPYFSGAKCIDRSILGTHIGSCSLEFHHKKICPSSECICAGKFGLDLHDYASGNDLKRALGHSESQKERELPKAPKESEDKK